MPLPPLFGGATRPLLLGGEDDTQTEPNDDFSLARVAAFGFDGTASITGSIAPSSDVDIIDIGTITPGDRIIIDVTAQEAGLDAVVALFDDASRLVAENDDRDLSRNELDPFLDIVARHGGSPYHVGIAAVSRTTGPYSMRVQVIPGSAVPAPHPQTVLLDFDGGMIELPGRGVHVVDAFSAAAVDRSFAGFTKVMKDVIVATVSENFAPFNVVVLNTDEHPVPPAGTFSRVLFGGSSSNSFGASYSVDAYNDQTDDEAIIYTEVYTPRVFQAPIAAEDAAVAMGNVASHEFGHLLGLNHVADPLFIMDTVGRPSTLLRDQDFGVAPLDISIFPIGFQDGGLLLSEIVGWAE